MLNLYERQFLIVIALVLNQGFWDGTGVSLVEAAKQSQLYQLMDDLFGSYKPEVRPTTAGEATYVFISMYLLSIQDLNEKSQVLETSIIVEAFWVDDYLSWNAASYGNATYFNYPQKKIWLPDVVVENSVESQRQLGYDMNMVTIVTSGLVHWKPSQVIKTSCDIDVTYYPFDTQVCNIIVSTWMSTKNDIDIDPSSGNDGMILDRYSASGTWELLSNQLEILPNENDLTRIQFKLRLKRLRTFYVLNIILPVLFLSFTASMVFYLPADAGEKIGMGITVLLAYAVYLTIIADNMPQTSLQVSYLAVYLTLLLGLTAMGVVLSVIVLHVHHKPDDCKVSRQTEAIVRKLRLVLGLYNQGPKEDEQPSTTEPNASKDENCRPKLSNTFLKRLKGTVTPLENVQTVSPPPTYSESEVNEEITWPKIAETLDRVMFILTSALIVITTAVFLPLLAIGSK
ncbi:neuronal acetylcholine receptor subunit alpha-3 [Plakobranchus ocellatus]|uniref:Neuronal acetylcholine receptor subunit alpha-3 n=1 Tax=Plakobranchus ocellatus TaxID=259542 RepID=A0AAV4C934_9GAST|nr:neuronal acetylcholine receptor subunit alpha-3 [Plakobranchus ocellatus]